MVQEFTTDEGVPLTEDVFEKGDRGFFPTFAEWVADGNAEQIFRSISAVANGIEILFTVPLNHTLFITSMSMSCMDVGVAAHGFAAMRKRGTEVEFLSIANDHGNIQAPTVSQNSNSFPMPLRFNQGEIIEIRVENFSSPQIRANFQGFLLPKKISIR